MPYPVTRREASISSLWEQMKRPTVRHAERESKLGVSIKFFPSDLKKYSRRERKYETARECRGHKENSISGSPIHQNDIPERSSQAPFYAGVGEYSRRLR